MTRSADEEDRLVLVVLAAEAPGEGGFIETHYHRFLDWASDMEVCGQMVQQYAALGATINLTYLDPPAPLPKPTHRGTPVIQ